MIQNCGTLSVLQTHCAHPLRTVALVSIALSFQACYKMEAYITNPFPDTLGCTQLVKGHHQFVLVYSKIIVHSMDVAAFVTPYPGKALGLFPVQSYHEQSCYQNVGTYLCVSYVHFSRENVSEQWVGLMARVCLVNSKLEVA